MKEKTKQMFTGTLIEDLIATVERAEVRTQQITPMEIEACSIELWAIEAQLASAQENQDSEPKLLGVA
jgi:hypothetical protein